MNKEKLKTVISIVLLVVFVGMIFAGFSNGESEVVLQKAQNICMECIGIG